MLAMFLTLYRRKQFVKNLKILDKKKLNETGVWSTIDNTAPHVKVFFIPSNIPNVIFKRNLYR